MQTYRIVGDPTEGAMLVAAAKAGTLPVDIKEAYPRESEVPFDSDRKRMITVHDVAAPCRGDLSPEEAEGALRDFQERLRLAHEEVRLARAEGPVAVPADREGVEGAARPPVATAAGRDALAEVLDGLDRVPPGFTIHPKLGKQLARRRETFEGDRIDWALAEALALGTLVLCW